VLDPRAAVSDLNRSRAWGRHGRCHLWREVVPFQAIAFLGLAFSTWAADFGITMASRAAASHGGDHGHRDGLVAAGVRAPLDREVRHLQRAALHRAAIAEPSAQPAA
jgi:hypothetical protein